MVLFILIGTLLLSAYDVYLELDLSQWERRERNEFPGTSHEKITEGKEVEERYYGYDGMV